MIRVWTPGEARVCSFWGLRSSGIERLWEAVLLSPWVGQHVRHGGSTGRVGGEHPFHGVLCFGGDAGPRVGVEVGGVCADCHQDVLVGVAVEREPAWGKGGGKQGFGDEETKRSKACLLSEEARL